MTDFLPESSVQKAVLALVGDMAGFKQENFPDHIIQLAYGDNRHVPAEFEELVESAMLSERISRALFDLDTVRMDENDWLFFHSSIQTPLQAQIAIIGKGLDIDDFLTKLFSKHDKPVDSLDVAMAIAFKVGSDSPKYFDAVSYLLSGKEVVPEAMLECLKNDIDLFCESMDITLATDESGECIYDVEDMISQAEVNHNAKQ